MEQAAEAADFGSSIRSISNSMTTSCARPPTAGDQALSRLVKEFHLFAGTGWCSAARFGIQQGTSRDRGGAEGEG